MKHKTKTGALPSSAGFPGTDKIGGTWIEKQMKILEKQIKEDQAKYDDVFWKAAKRKVAKIVAEGNRNREKFTK